MTRSRRKRRRRTASNRSVVERSSARVPQRRFRWSAIENRFALLLLIAAVALGGVLRIRGTPTSLNSDEGISLLAATGHQGEYSRIINKHVYPFGQFVSSADWRRLILPEKRFCFGTISADLARTDKHPPLYFWFLHLWLLIVGLHAWTGVSLNLIFFSLTALGIYRLGVHALGRRIEAAAAAALWCCSPVVLQSSYEARQYELLALCTVWFTVHILRCVQMSTPPRARHWCLLGLSAAAGILVHYHFVIALAAGGIYAIVRLVGKRRRLLIGVASVLLGLGVACLLHPIASHIGRQSKRMKPDSPDYQQRVRVCYNRYRAFVMDDRQVLPRSVRKPYVLVFPYAFLGLCGVMAGVGIWRRRTQPEATGVPKPAIGSLLFFLLAYAAGNIGLYVSGVSPLHAMAGKYPCMVWPLLAFVPVLLARPIPRARVPIQLVMCAFWAYSGCVQVDWKHDVAARLGDQNMTLKWDNPVIVDDVNLLRLPRLLFHIPDDIPMLAAYEGKLLRTYDQWTGQLARQNLYLGLSNGKLFRRLKRDFRFQRGRSGLSGYRIVGTLHKK